MKQLQQRVKALYDDTTAKNILMWLYGDFPQEDKDAIVQLLQDDPSQLKELFGKTLTFGTGGLRSPMGMGTNRMNTFTVSRASQGISLVLRRHQLLSSSTLKVVVGYDTRHHSEEFAHEAAKVFAGNGIHVLLFKCPEPLALVSFTVRQEQAAAGVMITASHNPPEYNGYKVYMASGGQVLPPLDEEIVKEYAAVQEVLSVASIHDPHIHMIGEEYETIYRRTIQALQQNPNENRLSGRALKISYTPLHGTGVPLIPRVLHDWGFCSVKLVEKQAIPDGSFSTVHLPNPEDPEALTLGIQQLITHQDDLLIATDPDADRVGIVCLEEGQSYRFSGNQIACVLADHILKGQSAKAPLTENDKVVKSLVTTELLTAIAQHYGADLVNVGTGFKYIGEKIESWRGSSERFLFGAEESYGYLCGTYVEDKDAVSSSALLAEAALQQKLLGKTLRDVLLELYELHGYVMNTTESLAFVRQEEEKIRSKLQQLEQLGKAFPSLGNFELLKYENYHKNFGLDVVSGTTYPLELPRMSMLCYYFSHGGRLIVRPSGTEPKIKFYFEIIQRYMERAQNKEEQLRREQESMGILERFISEFKNLFFAL